MSQQIYLVVASILVVVGISCNNSQTSSEKNQNVKATSVSDLVTQSTSVVIHTPSTLSRTVPTSTPADPMSGVDAIAGDVQNLMKDGFDVQYRTDGPTARYPTLNGVVLIGLGDEIIANVAQGAANVDEKVHMVPSTLFPLGRIADLFAATAVLQLHELGKLAVDDPIATVLPDFPHGGKVTPLHLITHTSGLPHLWDWEVQDVDEDGSIADDAAILLSEKTLRYEPGEKFNVEGGDAPVSSDSLMVRYVVEQVSGQSYEDYLSEHIFGPANMNNTAITPADSTVGGLALGYTLNGRTPVRIDQDAVPELAEDGHIVWSTSEDIFRWYRALKGGKLVRNELVERMFVPVLELANGVENAGLGWRVIETARGDNALLVSNVKGYNVELRAFPDNDLIVVVLTNLEDYYPPWGQLSWKFAVLAMDSLDQEK